MKNPKKVALKRLKRKRKLAGRMRAFGSTEKPVRLNPVKPAPSQSKIPQSVVDAVFKDIEAKKKEVSESWFTRLLRFLRLK